MTPNSIVIIPARLGSSRFPGKPLALINGETMISRVYRNSTKSRLSTTTIVATPDYDIYQHIISIGGRSILTSPNHTRASDRCAEALVKVQEEDSLHYGTVVMVQGDEPLIHHSQIDSTIDFLASAPPNTVTNLAGRFIDDDELNSPNSIKVVLSNHSKALYFTRSVIPFQHASKATFHKQVCVIGFTSQSLQLFSDLPATSLEEIESIDMLRLLQHGYTVDMLCTEYITTPVDVPTDIYKVTSILNQSIV